MGRMELVERGKIEVSQMHGKDFERKMDKWYFNIKFRIDKIRFIFL